MLLISAFSMICARNDGVQAILFHTRIITHTPLTSRAHLLVGRFTHVQDFPPERKDPVAISTYDPKPRDGERLGGVSFRQDECAFRRVLPT